MFTLFIDLVAVYPEFVGLCFFAVSFVFAFCAFSVGAEIRRDAAKAIKIPITGQTLRQATARAKAFSKRANGKHDYIVCLHTEGLWFAQYEIVRSDNYAKRKRVVNEVLCGYYEKIS